MKKSVIFVGIEVVHSILGPSRHEGSLNVHRHDALTLVVGQITGVMESGLMEGLPQVQRQAQKVGDRLLPMLAEPRRLPPRVLVTRGLLLATPALFALVAPTAARAAVAAAKKSNFLRKWLRPPLAAPPPRLPPAEEAIDKPPL